MRKYIFLILPLIVLLLSGCLNGTAETTVATGEKFTLSIGESATIIGENLKIRFVEVIGDSRCPQGVQCIWAGEASSLIEIIYTGEKYQKVLTQPGLTVPPRSNFGDYKITFDLQPYPEAGKEIDDKDYRLEIQID